MKIIENAELSNLCTFKIGGKASYLINWETREELPEIIEFARSKSLPLFVFGGGTNLLFPDEGLDAVVVRCMTNQIERSGENELILDAGLRWTKLQHYCREHNLYGWEGIFGIPGTVGGAVFGNAGAHGQELRDIILKVEYYDLDNDQSLIHYEPSDGDFDYRWSVFKDNLNWIVMRAWFHVGTCPDESIGDPEEFARFRKEKQPQGLTTGSFFKNPEGDYAGRLLEEARLKGYRSGGVGFSEKHANFVINYGTGTAKDVIELTKHAQNVVKAKLGIDLHPEVRVVTEKDLLSLN